MLRVAAWLENAERARWTSVLDVRKVYPAADQLGQCLIFDVRGNNYRLITTVVWAGRGRGTLFVKHFLTHAEYDKGAWKDCCKS